MNTEPHFCVKSEGHVPVAVHAGEDLAAPLVSQRFHERTEQVSTYALIAVFRVHKDVDQVAPSRLHLECVPMGEAVVPESDPGKGEYALILL